MVARTALTACLAAPVALFDTGAGGAAQDWAEAQPRIAEKTRACFDDRAGPGFSDEGIAAVARVWTQMRSGFAALSTRDRRRIIADAGHCIQRDRPGAVRDAVIKVVAQVLGQPAAQAHAGNGPALVKSAGEALSL